MDRNGEKRSCCRLHWCTNKRQSGICGTHNEPPAAPLTSNNEKESVGKENGKRNGIRGSAGGTGLICVSVRVAPDTRHCVSCLCGTCRWFAFIFISLRPPACSWICIHAFGCRRRSTAKRQRTSRQLDSLGASVCNRVFSCVRELWGFGDCGRRFSFE